MRSRCLLAAAAAAIAISGQNAPAIALDWRQDTVATVDGLRDVRLDRETRQVNVITADKPYRLSYEGGRFVLTRLPWPEASSDASDMIPHGRVAYGAGTVSQAWLARATDRYRHGVLGDEFEAESLRLRLRDGRVLEHRLADDSVFEDLEPRIVTLDGEEAVVVIRAYIDWGAAVAAYRVAGDEIEPFGESAPIGMSHRWLNPVGAADFDGDGKTEIAAVVTPHLSGLLSLYERDGGSLRGDGVRGGYSTHFIGSTVLGMSLIADADGDGVPDIVLPSLDRDHLAVVTFAGGSSRELLSLAQPAKIVTSIVSADLDGRGAPEIVFGRADGTLAVISR